MRYDIVSLNSSYGGVERTLTHDDLLSKNQKNILMNYCHIISSV